MNNKNNSLQKHGLSAKTSSNITNTFIYIALILMTVIWLFPFVGIVLESYVFASAELVNPVVEAPVVEAPVAATNPSTGA